MLKRSLLPITGGLIVLGAALLFLSILVAPHILPQILKTPKKATAVISRIDSYSKGDSVSHSVYVTYTVGDNKYSDVKCSDYASWWQVGDEMEILYNPRINYDTVTGSGTIYFVRTVLVLFIADLVLIFFPFFKNIRNNILRERTGFVMAKINGASENTKIRLSGRHPYNIHVTYVDTDSKQIYNFRSDNIWSNPINELAVSGLTELPVYVNLERPKRYFVDISEIFG